MNDDRILLLLFPFAFIAIWLAITAVLRNMSGMVKGLSRDLGTPLRTSRWGSANVNGAGFRNCMKVIEYQHGFILRTMWVFGGGEAWLPRNNLQVSEMKPREWLRPRRVDITCGGYRIELYDRLADFTLAPTNTAGTLDGRR